MSVLQGYKRRTIAGKSEEEGTKETAPRANRARTRPLEQRSYKALAVRAGMELGERKGKTSVNTRK